VISLNGVSKYYPGGNQGLQDVDLAVETSEFTFITGHSGAGKSTLLRLIALMDRATHGQIFVGGKNLARIPIYEIPYYRRQIGMVFQDHSLLPSRTVYDNVALPLSVIGARRSEIRKRVHAALDKVGLLDREGATPSALSVGEQQRVGIARAVVNRPTILLADEPTGNLDPSLSREILELFHQFNQVGVTVLIATHDHDLLKTAGRRVIELRNGKLISDTGLVT